MKILIISHNVFSECENMGKTLSKLFSEFDSKDLCQLYFHSEVPTLKDVCDSYYRITEKDIIKNFIVFPTKGTVFSNEKVDDSNKNSRIDTGRLAHIYQIGRKRTTSIYFLRDTLWRLGNWFNNNLKEWLMQNRPDVIFFAAGDYSFSYIIANRISRFLKIPIVMYCVDDFYLNNTNESFLGKIRHYLFMKNVTNTVKISNSIITICEKMSKDYNLLFNKKCSAIYTTSKSAAVKFKENPSKFAYFGSLGLERDKSLLEVAECIYDIRDKTGIEYIDIYTAENNKEVLDCMSKSKGVRIHSSVSEKEMLKILQNCRAVLHVESFNKNVCKRTKYSISTKIAESLAYGPCLFAYGPKDVASIEYLLKNNVAYVISDRIRLKEGLLKCLTDVEGRNFIIANARKLSKIKHDSEINHKLLIKELENAIIKNEG